MTVTEAVNIKTRFYQKVTEQNTQATLDFLEAKGNCVAFSDHSSTHAQYCWSEQEIRDGNSPVW